MQWVRALGERDFVGTESRLNTIFDLLRQIVFGTETDPRARIEELKRQQRQLDEEIARIGQVTSVCSTPAASVTAISSSPRPPASC